MLLALSGGKGEADKEVLLLLPLNWGDGEAVKDEVLLDFKERSGEPEEDVADWIEVVRF